MSTKRTPQARQTEIVHEGLTVTTWGDANYGYLHLLGAAGEENSATIVDVIFTTVKVQGGGDSAVEVVAKALARLSEATS